MPRNVEPEFEPEAAPRDPHLLLRRVLQFLACGVWLFVLLSIASFHDSDWPSHNVYPHGTTQNLCGSAGAFVAYWTYAAIGQGVFPILAFTGFCCIAFIFQAKVGDWWMRLIGLTLISVAFATVVHHLYPGSNTSFPEGNGGWVGISFSTYLHGHLNTVGTRLVLGVTILVGILLAADDLLARVPSVATATAEQLRNNTARFNFPELPTLPSLPKFRTVGAEATDLKPRAAKAPVPKMQTRRTMADIVDDGESSWKLPALLRRKKPAENQIDLSYDNDEPAEEHAAFSDDSEPTPATAAVIPPAAPSMAIPVHAAPAVFNPTVEQSMAVTSTPAPDYVNGPSVTPIDAPDDAEGPATIAPPEIRRDIKVKLPSMARPRQVSPPPRQELGEYQLPDWSVLGDAEHGYVESQEQFVREQAALLEQALREFNIDAHVVEIDTGPVITMYELALAPGIKVSTISALSNDIQRSLKAETVRIVAPIPGKSTVGIEVPNAEKEKVRLKELMQQAPDGAAKDGIPIFLGKDASGEPLIADLTKMPHCLIAGTTGSGKSVCINTIIMSIMYLQRPDTVKLILVDPKVVEMAPFKDIPHLMCPVINETGRATSVLDWACEKMDERYEILSEAGVRNIKDYNKLTLDELKERFEPSNEEEEAKIPKKLPYIVIIIDELADLMMTSGKEVESFIVRLAQKARAVGIHLVLATQRPQATVVTGLIKSNMPSKIAFRVASKMDSRIVLDQNGAELLLGQGDMLFLPPGASKPMRGQGTYIDDKEIRDSVKLVKSMAAAQYEPELVQIKATLGEDGDMERDELFEDAVRIVLETKRGSVSLLQRRLTIGYSRASRLIEQMAAAGLVGDYKGSQAREATITLEEYEAAKAQQQADEESGMTV
ncbi:MAG TPA: DNA translocase FtsK [Tepidisphaeraceae bacterium]|nr:DNA translocase FtsK [Tepidisphaeraceae bacterium]